MIFELSGPPSSGKTTVFNYLKHIFAGEMEFFEEINPYTFFKKHKGGAFVDFDLELEIIKADFNRLQKVVNLKKHVLLETGLFHLVYLKRLTEKENTEKTRDLYSFFENNYLSFFNSIPHLIIFIDTKPELSWQRRRLVYRKRVGKIIKENGGKVRELMGKYKNNLFELYNYFKGFYDFLPLNKILVKNNYRSKKSFLDEVKKIIIERLEFNHFK